MMGADVIGVGAPTLVETSLVLSLRLGSGGERLLQRVLQAAEVDVLPFRADHWEVARTAYERFGKGRHPAGLNLGDCFSYATARVAGRPLLCVGDDFPLTDLPLVALT
jgi:ribonuclease VapC